MLINFIGKPFNLFFLSSFFLLILIIDIVHLDIRPANLFISSNNTIEMNDKEYGIFCINNLISIVFYLSMNFLFI